MRPANVAAVMLAMLTSTGCGGSKKAAVVDTSGNCAQASRASAGNAQITARAVGKGYGKLVVIHASEKTSGRPVHGGKVSIRGDMCSHVMPMYTQRLQETSAGTYRARYQFIMPGRWTLYITVRDKRGGATTSALPVTVKVGG